MKPLTLLLCAEEDQLLAAIDAVTLAGEDAADAVADLLSGASPDADDLAYLSPDERRVAMLYARIGRNVYLRHLTRERP